jgi:phosphopantothenoylcysteine synthetase/decarboxylase
MHVIVTCGPAFEPIDGTRRLTNFSTGRLGIVLADAFHRAGHRVTVLRGSGATFRLQPDGVRLLEFGTNAEIVARFMALAEEGGVGAVCHLAALCDFGVARVLDPSGAPLPPGKIPSRSDGCQIVLQPLPKVIHRLRALFPQAYLAGWKYETEGDRARVVALGRRQLAEAATDLCVVNGPGYGDGFGLVDPAGHLAEASGPEALAEALLGRLAARG